MVKCGKLFFLKFLLIYILFFSDAKFRLGIMTLMSMSMILLAIVEDMPKFSISSSRKGRGSISGIPLIGFFLDLE